MQAKLCISPSSVSDRFMLPGVIESRPWHVFVYGQYHAAAAAASGLWAGISPSEFSDRFMNIHRNVLFGIRDGKRLQRGVAGGMEMDHGWQSN